jgi:3-deoxy-manno-octulosonate cytidylyltransferase (CMP-KDO synthetase)
MRTAIVIPARYGSTRLPAKPLLRSTGKYLVQHVYEKACAAKKARLVVVATDDRRIAAAVEGFGGNVVMTSSEHSTGTDRVAEVAADLDVDVVINVQGDEPDIAPEAIDLLPDLLMRDAEADMATVATPIRNMLAFHDPNCVKVVCDERGRAIYFSRSPIPYVREGEPDFHAEPPRFLQHLGLYAYRRDFLLKMATTPATTLEQDERLEQLRVLFHGGRIAVGLVGEACRGVDTLSDYEQFVRQFRRRRAAAA